MTPAQGDICGEIRLKARAEGGRIVSVEILSTRPVAAARVFEGKPVSQLCESIGRVFSLCGTAQTVAALAASEAALGIAPDPGVTAARDLARRAEMLTQTAMRLALHWPRALGLPLRPELVRACLAAEAAIAAEVLGEGWRRPGAGVSRPGPALAETFAALDTLIQQGDPGAPLAEALAGRGLEGYGALPVGTAPEAGALSRAWNVEPVARARARHGAGLAARLEAARAELALLPLSLIETLAEVTPAPARRAERRTGQGAAEVETARGPLLHRLAIDDGDVTTCTTEAPTEANFAPDGPAVAGLVGAAADPLAAELHVLAIDPCVAATLEIAEA